ENRNSRSLSSPAADSPPIVARHPSLPCVIVSAPRISGPKDTVVPQSPRICAAGVAFCPKAGARAAPAKRRKSVRVRELPNGFVDCRSVTRLGDGPAFLPRRGGPVPLGLFDFRESLFGSITEGGTGKEIRDVRHVAVIPFHQCNEVIERDVPEVAMC